MPRALLRKTRRGRPTEAILTASPVLHELITILISQNISYRQVAKRAGFGLNAPTRWARGINAPSILTCEALAEILGYRIVLEKGTTNGNGKTSQDARNRQDVDELNRSPTAFDESTETD